jgi:hypothetical protein
LKPGGSHRGGGGDEIARARNFLHGTLELVVDELEPIDGGWVSRLSSLPLVWAANQVRVSRPIEYDEALALAEEHQRELPYRQLAVEHDASGRSLERAFRADGWEGGTRSSWRSPARPTARSTRAP